MAEGQDTSLACRWFHGDSVGSKKKARALLKSTVIPNAFFVWCDAANGQHVLSFKIAGRKPLVEHRQIHQLSSSTFQLDGESNTFTSLHGLVIEFCNSMRGIGGIVAIDKEGFPCDVGSTVMLSPSSAMAYQQSLPHASERAQMWPPKRPNDEPAVPSAPPLPPTFSAEQTAALQAMIQTAVAASQLPTPPAQLQEASPNSERSTGDVHAVGLDQPPPSYQDVVHNADQLPQDQERQGSETAVLVEPPDLVDKSCCQSCFCCRCLCKCNTTDYKWYDVRGKGLFPAIFLIIGYIIISPLLMTFLVFYCLQKIITSGGCSKCDSSEYEWYDVRGKGFLPAIFLIIGYIIISPFLIITALVYCVVKNYTSCFSCLCKCDTDTYEWYDVRGKGFLPILLLIVFYMSLPVLIIVCCPCVYVRRRRRQTYYVVV